MESKGRFEQLPGDGVGALISQAAALYDALLADALAPHRLTPAAARLLRTLWHREEPWVAQAEAVRRSRLPEMDVSRLLATFERGALVERGPRQGRGRTVRLTEPGARLAALAVAASNDAESRFLRPLGAARGGLKGLVRQLVRLER